jgi:hypothetical protein
MFLSLQLLEHQHLLGDSQVVGGVEATSSSGCLENQGTGLWVWLQIIWPGGGLTQASPP